MSIARGDVVLVEFPMSVGTRKRRPALVVQSNYNNARLSNSVFAMITSNIRLSSVEATQVLIDITSPVAQQCGLRHTSAVNLYTLPSAAVRNLERLPDELMQQVNSALKKSLELI